MRAPRGWGSRINQRDLSVLAPSRDCQPKAANDRLALARRETRNAKRCGIGLSRPRDADVHEAHFLSRDRALPRLGYRVLRLSAQLVEPALPRALKLIHEALAGSAAPRPCNCRSLFFAVPYLLESVSASCQRPGAPGDARRCDGGLLIASHSGGLGKGFGGSRPTPTVAPDRRGKLPRSRASAALFFLGSSLLPRAVVSHASATTPASTVYDDSTVDPSILYDVNSELPYDVNVDGNLLSRDAPERGASSLFFGEHRFGQTRYSRTVKELGAPRCDGGRVVQHDAASAAGDSSLAAPDEAGGTRGARVALVVCAFEGPKHLPVVELRLAD